MADVVVSQKKLKQGRLSFGKIQPVKSLSTDKENYLSKRKTLLEGNAPLTPHDTNISNDNDDVIFKSISKKLNEPKCNQLEVPVEVHQTIQCPEVSTSSIHSDSDIDRADDVIDLTESIDENAVMETSEMSLELHKRIDETIDAVIAKGLSDRENMIKNADQIRERKRQRKAKSPNPQEPTSILSQKSDKAVNLVSNDGECTSVEIADHKSKKPRRSILDMFSAPKSNKPFTSATGKPSCGNIGIEFDEDLIMVSNEVVSEPMEVVSEPMEVVSEPMEVTEIELSRASTTLPKRCRVSSSCESSVRIELVKCDEGESSVNGSDSTSDAKIHIKKRKISADPNETSLNTSNISSESAEKRSVDVNDHLITASANTVLQSKGEMSKTPNKKSETTRKLSPATLKLREEKKKEREEKKRQKEEEKQAREQEKLEVKRKKEEERLQREEEKQKKREELERMKEEKAKKKQEEVERKKAEMEARKLEKEKKDEEKRKEKEQRELEKKAKEEEKQQLALEKIKAEEEKRRISQKRAMSFKNYFTPSPKNPNVKKSTEKVVGSFIPFQLKEDMFLSPKLKKLNTDSSSALDQHLTEQRYSHSYLSEIKNSEFKRSRSRTVPKRSNKMPSLCKDGLELIGSGEIERPVSVRAKLLQFSENNRPPYYGTWRKASKLLNPRNPFAQDKTLLDYEIDSDDEWEDPGEGEDIANSDGEEEGDKEDDEDEGDGFFVPHGYLSDDEGIKEDGDEDDVKEELSDQKLKMKQQEFENSFKQKIKVMTPLVVGCIWEDNEDNFCSSDVTLMHKYEVQFFIPTPIDLDEAPSKTTDDSKSKSENKSIPSSKRGVPEEAIPDLVRMLHGNPHSLGRLIPEFQMYWEKKHNSFLKSGVKSQTGHTMENSTGNGDEKNSSSGHPSCASSLNPNPLLLPGSSLTSSPSGVTGLSMVLQQDRMSFLISKTQLNKKIREIGAYGKKENLTRACWFVLDSVFEKYSLKQSDYPVPCKWEYITFEPDVKLAVSEITSTESSSTSDPSPKACINKFASKVSAETLLERSILKIKQEKEKQAQQQALQQVNQFATAKIHPDRLLAMSSQKIEEDQIKQKRRVNLTTISVGKDESQQSVDMNDAETFSAGFVVPTHDAFKSFFKIAQAPAKKSGSTLKDPTAKEEEPKSSENVTCPPDENASPMEVENSGS